MSGRYSVYLSLAILSMATLISGSTAATPSLRLTSLNLFKFVTCYKVGWGKMSMLWYDSKHKATQVAKR